MLMIRRWQHNVRKETLKTYLHTFQNGTKMSGLMKIFIAIQLVLNVIMSSKNTLFIQQTVIILIEKPH